MNMLPCRLFPHVLGRWKASRRVLRCLGVAVCLMVGVPSPAAAAEDPAAAELLFQKGRAAMEEGRLKEACQKFAESHRLDPAPGAVMNLATCEQKRGHLAKAWEHWQQAVQLLDQGDKRRDYALTRVEELEAELPHLTIVLVDEAPPESVVRRDGVELGAPSLGVPLPVDPGKHEIVVTSPNHAARTFRIDIDKGEERRVLVQPGSALPDTDEQPNTNDQRTWAYVAGGIGVAGVASAITTGILVNDRQATVNQNCTDRVCNQRGLDAASQGDALLAANTASWVIGGLGLAAGTVLFFTSPSEKTAQPEEPTRAASVGFIPGGATVNYEGTF